VHVCLMAITLLSLAPSYVNVICLHHKQPSNKENVRLLPRNGMASQSYFRKQTIIPLFRLEHNPPAAAIWSERERAIVKHAAAQFGILKLENILYSDFGGEGDEKTTFYGIVMGFAEAAGEMEKIENLLKVMQ
jgi:hypothetical protein